MWHQCDSCDYKAKQAGNLKQHKNTLTILMSSGTSAMKIIATTKLRQKATSNYTNNLFAILASFGTTAIYATTEPSKQAASKNINKIFTVSDQVRKG